MRVPVHVQERILIAFLETSIKRRLIEKIEKKREGEKNDIR